MAIPIIGMRFKDIFNRILLILNKPLYKNTWKKSNQISIKGSLH